MLPLPESIVRILMDCLSSWLDRFRPCTVVQLLQTREDCIPSSQKFHKHPATALPLPVHPVNCVRVRAKKILRQIKKQENSSFTSKKRKNLLTANLLMVFSSMASSPSEQATFLQCFITSSGTPFTNTKYLKLN